MNILNVPALVCLNFQEWRRSSCSVTLISVEAGRVISQCLHLDRSFFVPNLLVISCFRHFCQKLLF